MSQELGTLVVVVLKARNLPDKHSFYKQDVFAQVTLQGVTKKTKIDVKGGQHPVWDEELRFPVYDKKSKMMEVSCWSKEPRSDDMVGKGELDVTETLRTGEFDDWVPLGINNVMRGDLYLEMTFYAAGPPPALSRRPSKFKPADRLAKPATGSPPLGAPSSPPSAHHPPSDIDSAFLKPHAASAQRLSPRLQEHALPALPEEPAIDAPAPESLPAILRPGGGKPHAPHHRQSQSSISGIPAAPTPQPDINPQSPPQTHRDSLPLPAFLRPGGGASPTPIPPTPSSSFIPESQIPSLSSAAVGSAPASTPTPQPYGRTSPTSQPTFEHRPVPGSAPIPGHTSHSSIHHSPTSQPTYDAYNNRPVPGSLPVPGPTPQPSIHHSPTPQPTYDHRQAPGSIPVAGPTPQPYTYHSPPQGPVYDRQTTPQPPTYAPPPQGPVYDQRPIPALPPQAQPNPTSTPQAWQSSPPPGGYPHLQPSTYTAGLGYSSFSFPAPSVAPYPPAPYPPAAQPPSNGYYSPYGPPPPSRPYPYNYPPPPRDPDLDSPGPLNNPRYQKPLPLPAEPEGAQTPMPAHPHVAGPGPAKQNGHHQKTRSRDASSSKPRETFQSAEERDRIVALQLEREEEERRRVAKEQEERDLELARQLDLELNLDGEGEPAPPSVEVHAGHGERRSNAGMPGSW